MFSEGKVSVVEREVAEIFIGKIDFNVLIPLKLFLESERFSTRTRNTFNGFCELYSRLYSYLAVLGSS
jgi:hypothetical protein